jgi:hypothetical protein
MTMAILQLPTISPSGAATFSAPFSDELSSNDPAKGWNHMGIARRATPFKLSAPEILLDKGCCGSASDQRVILERILASAHHLHCMIATLTKPDEQLGEIFLEAVNTGELRER